MHEKLGIGADNINDHTAPSLTDSFDELFEFPYIFWPQKKIKFQKARPDTHFFVGLQNKSFTKVEFFVKMII